MQARLANPGHAHDPAADLGTPQEPSGKPFRVAIE